MSTDQARPPQEPAAPAKPRRSRGGYNECRRRHRKCDEAKPICRFCRDAGKECVYGQRLSWGGRPFGKSNPYLGSGMERTQTDEPSTQRREMFSPSGRRNQTSANPTASLDRSFIYTMSASPSTSTPTQEQRPSPLEPTPEQILESLPNRSWLPARSRQLIEHFVKHMGPALSLTKQMHDEMCSVILPMALVNDSPNYLLAAVLCLAGTHRFVLGIDLDEAEHVTWRHECIVSMQSAVSQSNGRQEDSFIAAALLICYSDILEGGEKPMSWSLHLRGALAKLGQSDASPVGGDSGNRNSTKVSISRRHLSLRCCSLQTLAYFGAWNSSLQMLEISGAPAVGITDSGSSGMDVSAISQIHGFAVRLNSVLEDMHIALSEKAALKELDGHMITSDIHLESLWQCLTLRSNRMLAQVRSFLEASKSAPLRFQTSRNADWNAGAIMSPLLLDEWGWINEAFHHACIVFILCELQGLQSSHDQVQQAVARGLWCMKQLEIRNEPCPAAALLQPLFVIGCETTDLDDRSFVLRTIDKVRKLFGKANARNAAEFLEILWQRRDNATPLDCVSVADLMEEKAWNLSLK